MSLYDKPVRLLFKDMVEDWGVKPDEVLTRDQVVLWFEKNYPKVKDGTIAAHLLKMSTNAPSRVHYNVNPEGDDDLLYQIDSQRFRLYDPDEDPRPIYEKEKRIGQEEGQEENELESSALATSVSLERDLERSLVTDVGQLESGLEIYDEEGIIGHQLDTGVVGRIDILATDKDQNYVVIELKAGEAGEKVCGQILRYMGWVNRELAEGNLVRGIVVANSFDESVRYAAEAMPNVSLKRYQVHFEYTEAQT